MFRLSVQPNIDPSLNSDYFFFTIWLLDSFGWIFHLFWKSPSVLLKLSFTKQQLYWYSAFLGMELLHRLYFDSVACNWWLIPCMFWYMESCFCCEVNNDDWRIFVWFMISFHLHLRKQTKRTTCIIVTVLYFSCKPENKTAPKFKMETSCMCKA